MVKEDLSLRSSIHVAPLSINKGRSRGSSTASSKASSHRRNTSSRSSSKTGVESTTSSQSQMTPPATPNGSEEDLSNQLAPQPVFHNFLRAFYPFHPTYAISDTTVTLPLSEGDVILVHSIHTNGWADGTLLISGARGWLPTNYCEAYDPDWMRSLLKALLNFWDLLGSGMATEGEVFANQEFMRGIIAGVRYLLEKSNCLTRESPLVQSNEQLRRNRKALLSDLSALVKTAKRLQEYTERAQSSISGIDEVNNTMDEMILKAFKIVTRGVRFLDVLEEDVRTRQQPVRRQMATVAEESYNPPTPPADATSFEGRQRQDPTSDAASRRSSTRSSGSGLSGVQRSEDQSNRQSYKRMSSTFSTTSSASRPLSISSRPMSVQLKRQSFSHRLSASLPVAQRQNLVSEKLHASHNDFLSFLGTFVGRSTVQSQPSSQLILSVQQSVAAGQDLLIVVSAICAHNSQSADALATVRDTMYDQISQLVAVAQDIVTNSGIDDEDVVLTEPHGPLMAAVNACVKAAGECVARSRNIIERIGDFEFEANSQGLGLDLASIGVEQEETKSTPVPPQEITPNEPANRPPPPPLIIPSYEKPLPDVPPGSPPTEAEFARLSLRLQPVVEDDSPDSTTTNSSKSSSRKSLLPPLPKMTSPLMTQEDYSPSEPSSGQDGEFVSFRSTTDSLAMSNSGTTGSMRDSETSMLSQTSTRATTPDLTGYHSRNKPSTSDQSFSGSQSTLADDLEDGESKMLEKTFAHELLFNKEGQITGGTLAALVERLTTHDSTPDAIFVSTFYLTFRLFATPIELATALVERFDYVAESPHIATPVRLRVYNVFKGWLESHWRELSDHQALSIIEPFAQDKLGQHVPAAGKRLLDLAQKVSTTEGPLVPRLVSSMGKTSTAIAQYIPADAPLPPLALSRSQQAILKNWKMGGSNPTIIDFDPLELARQLTIKGMNIFCSIMPEELLGSEWTKRSGSNAVNVRGMSTLATDLANLVADTILQYDDAKKRATVIKHWIKIAHKCLELNNYDTLMAIICSLNSSTIIRLKRTWDMVSQKRKDMLNSLQAIVEPDKNYTTLRKRLHDHVPPCLPFVGTYLTDLTFVDAGNSATKQLPSLDGTEGMSVINFDKHTRTAKIIGELQRFQIPYRLRDSPELQEWLQAQIVRVKSSSEIENVTQMYRKSLLLEPREKSNTLQIRQSPVDIPFTPATSGKFDIWAWTHTREKELPAQI